MKTAGTLSALGLWAPLLALPLMATAPCRADDAATARAMQKVKTIHWTQRTIVGPTSGDTDNSAASTSRMDCWARMDEPAEVSTALGDSGSVCRILETPKQSFLTTDGSSIVVDLPPPASSPHAQDAAEGLRHAIVSGILCRKDSPVRLSTAPGNNPAPRFGVSPSPPVRVTLDGRSVLRTISRWDSQGKHVTRILWVDPATGRVARTEIIVGGLRRGAPPLDMINEHFRYNETPPAGTFDEPVGATPTTDAVPPDAQH